MAEISISTPAPSANGQHRKIDSGADFDPATWLACFREAGGWWIVGADNHISIGWVSHERDPIANSASRALWREIESTPGKRSALEHLLLYGAQRLPVGLPASYSGTTLYLAGTRPAEPAPGTVQKPEPERAAWTSAINAFERADRFEELFRETVFNPVDAVAAVGDPVGEAADRAMDAVNGVTDQARRVALRVPAPDGQALRWKMEQFLVEKVMPHPPAGEIEQIFADFDRLLAAGGSAAALA